MRTCSRTTLSWICRRPLPLLRFLGGSLLRSQKILALPELLVHFAVEARVFDLHFAKDFARVIEQVEDFLARLCIFDSASGLLDPLALRIRSRGRGRRSLGGHRGGLAD